MGSWGFQRLWIHQASSMCLGFFCSNPVFVDFTLLTFNQHMNWFSWKKAGFETVSCPRCERNTIQVLFITFPSPSLPPSAQFFSFPSCYLRIVTASSCPDGRCTMMPSLCSPMAEPHGAVKSRAYRKWTCTQMEPFAFSLHAVQPAFFSSEAKKSTTAEVNVLTWCVTGVGQEDFWSYLITWQAVLTEFCRKKVLTVSDVLCISSD